MNSIQSVFPTRDHLGAVQTLLFILCIYASIIFIFVFCHYYYNFKSFSQNAQFQRPEYMRFKTNGRKQYVYDIRY